MKVTQAISYLTPKDTEKDLKDAIVKTLELSTPLIVLNYRRKGESSFITFQALNRSTPLFSIKELITSVVPIMSEYQREKSAIQPSSVFQDKKVSEISKEINILFEKVETIITDYTEPSKQLMNYKLLNLLANQEISLQEEQFEDTPVGKKVTDLQEQGYERGMRKGIAFFNKLSSHLQVFYRNELNMNLMDGSFVLIMH